MGDSLITIIAIFLAAILLFVFPLVAMSERTDDVSQLAVQTATADFVDNIRSTGSLSDDDYDKFLSTLAATGNSYDVEMEVSHLDENPGVKTTQAQMTKIGENLYYKEYTTQIEEKLQNNGKISLKQGDLVSVTVKNTNQTIAQSLKSFFYQLSGDNTYSISAQKAGIVQVNGKK